MEGEGGGGGAKSENVLNRPGKIGLRLFRMVEEKQERGIFCPPR